MRLALTLMLISLCSCKGVLTRLCVYSSRSPDLKAEVRVDVTGCVADCVVHVSVRHGWRPETIATRTDCFVKFAHATWSGQKVAVFVDASLCGPIKVAFDAASGSPVEFPPMEEELRNSIVKSYNVSPEELNSDKGDVFAWASYQGDGQLRRAQIEYLKRFPGR